MYYKLFRTKTELFKKYKHLVNMTIELSLASILANVVTNFRNTELNYISDFNLPGIYVGVFFHISTVFIDLFSKTEQRNLLAELAALHIPVWQYEKSALRNRQLDDFLPQACPIFETGYSLVYHDV